MTRNLMIQWYKHVPNNHIDYSNKKCISAYHIARSNFKLKW
jgi:hypothetical protein